MVSSQLHYITNREEIFIFNNKKMTYLCDLWRFANAYRTFEGKDSFIGAIFLDAGCEADFSSENSIVYGHNLKNGQMFGMLKKHYDTSYNADADYKDHQKIWIITPQEEIEYQVFAAREIDVNVDVDVYTIEFATEEDYADYLKTAVEKSLYHLGTKTDSTENIISFIPVRNGENRKIMICVSTAQTMASRKPLM